MQTQVIPPNGSKLLTILEDVTFVVENITPQMAAGYLKLNTFNRPHNELLVKRYSEAMKKGEWILTHQGIAFDRDNVVIDGQHRLKAIVESGRTVAVMVCRGLDPTVFRVLDRGRRRNLADDIAIAMGEKRYRSQIASTVNMAIAGSHVISHRSEASGNLDFAIKHYDLLYRVCSATTGGTQMSWAVKTGVRAAFFNAMRPADDDTPGPRGGYKIEDIFELINRYAAQQWDGGQDDPLFRLFARMERIHHHDVGRRRTDEARRAQYLYTVAAIRASLEGKTLNALTMARNDFPLTPPENSN
jgi:hypothetical protein